MIVDRTDIVVSKSILDIGSWERINIQIIASFLK
jgi:hypothetical protein